MLIISKLLSLSYPGNGPLKKKKVIYVPIRAVEIALLRCERYIQCLNHDDLDEEVDVSLHTLIKYYCKKKSQLPY